MLSTSVVKRHHLVLKAAVFFCLGLCQTFLLFLYFIFCLHHSCTPSFKPAQMSGCGAFLTLLMCVPLLNFFPPNSCFLVIAFSLSLFSKPWRWGKGKSRTGSIFRKRICMLQTDLWNSVCFKMWPNVACIAEKFQDWHKNEPFSKLEVVLTEPEWARAFQQNSCVKINLIRAIHYLIKHSWKLWKNLLKIPKEFEPMDMLGAPHPNK